jgi:pilus assembly protein Flp/PilA
MQQPMEHLSRDESGAALVEYGLLVGLLALSCLGAMSLLGQEISTVLTDLATTLAAV